jgi:hypothetical protein
MGNRVGSCRQKGREVLGGHGTAFMRKPRIGKISIRPQRVEIIMISLTIGGCKIF